jgi:hypothetical protein
MMFTPQCTWRRWATCSSTPTGACRPVQLIPISVGTVVGITVEWMAVHFLGWWMYTAWMPRIPDLAVGLVPVLQMLVLPPQRGMTRGLCLSWSQGR